MRRIGGEPGRALQFFLLGNKRGFDTSSARPIFFRIDRQFRDRRGQSFRNQVTGNEPNQQQDRARPENLPTQPLLPSERALQRINRNFVSGGERRTGIQLFEKEEMRVTVDLDPRTALGLVRDEETRHFLVHDRAGGTLGSFYTIGSRAFQHDLIEIAGGLNVFGEVDVETFQPSLEEVIRRKPDIILETLSPPADPQEIEQRKRDWERLGLRRERIYIEEETYLLIPGPRFGLAAHRISEIVRGIR